MDGVSRFTKYLVRCEPITSCALILITQQFPHLEIRSLPNSQLEAYTSQLLFPFLLISKILIKTAILTDKNE